MGQTESGREAAFEADNKQPTEQKVTRLEVAGWEESRPFNRQEND